MEIIDHLDQAQLREKYQHHNLNLDMIEEVDHIWNGEPYGELTGREKHYDWIIASHVIEHTPDLIGFLLDCDTVLKDDGVISLAVPDKRYCFDHYRPITGIGAVIDRHLTKNTISTPGAVAEYVLNQVRKDGVIAWSEESEGEYEFICNAAKAKQQMNIVRKHQRYIDCHSWCFVPHSFRLLISDLHALDLIPFKEVSFTATRGSEFFVTLGRHGSGVELSRMELLNEIDQEIVTGMRAAA